MSLMTLTIPSKLFKRWYSAMHEIPARKVMKYFAIHENAKLSLHSPELDPSETLAS
jgi:hypothetical protein